MSDEEYGPPLPPGLQNPTVKNKQNIGPQLPLSSQNPKLENENPDKDSFDLIGPSLPAGLLKKNSDCNTVGTIQVQSNQGDRDLNIIGPCLPSDIAFKKDCEVIIGPRVPQRFESRINSSSDQYRDNEDSNSDGEGCIGPQPFEISSPANNKNDRASQFEMRARLMKDRLEGKNKPEEKLQRESWMMELPSTGLAQNIGLTARTFRTRTGPDMGDRSMWTDTPADREKKIKEGLKEEQSKHKDSFVNSERDKQMAKEVYKYNKSKRPMSLLEMHEKERKMLKKEKGKEPQVRRPFDREIDLQTNRFDDAQRQSIIKKSRDLNTKFATGKFTSQFL